MDEPVDTAIGETFDATLEEKIIDLLEATGEVEEVFDEHIEAIGGYTDEIRFWDDFGSPKSIPGAALEAPREIP